MVIKLKKWILTKSQLNSESIIKI